MNRTAAGLLVAAATLLTLTACGKSYSPGPLINSTACGVLTADQSAGDTADIGTFVQGANPFTAGDDITTQFQAEANVLPDLLGECQGHPSEVLSAAYDNALSASESTTDAIAPVTPPATAESVPAAMQNFVVTDDTLCSAISDWYGTSGDSGPIRKSDMSIYGGSSMDSADPIGAYIASKGLSPADVSTIATSCSSSDGTGGEPDETVRQALKH